MSGLSASRGSSAGGGGAGIDDELAAAPVANGLAIAGGGACDGAGGEKLAGADGGGVVGRGGSSTNGLCTAGASAIERSGSLPTGTLISRVNGLKLKSSVGGTVPDCVGASVTGSSPLDVGSSSGEVALAAAPVAKGLKSGGGGEAAAGSSSSFAGNGGRSKSIGLGARSSDTQQPPGPALAGLS